MGGPQHPVPPFASPDFSPQQGTQPRPPCAPCLSFPFSPPILMVPAPPCQPVPPTPTGDHSPGTKATQAAQQGLVRPPVPPCPPTYPGMALWGHGRRDRGGGTGDTGGGTGGRGCSSFYGAGLRKSEAAGKCWQLWRGKEGTGATGGAQGWGATGAMAVAPPAARGAELSQSPCRGRGLRGRGDVILPWGRDPAPPSWGHWGQPLAPGSHPGDTFLPWGHPPTPASPLGDIRLPGIAPWGHWGHSSIPEVSSPTSIPPWGHWGHPRAPGSHLGDTPVSTAQACAPAVRRGW